MNVSRVAHRWLLWSLSGMTAVGVACATPALLTRRASAPPGDEYAAGVSRTHDVARPESEEESRQREMSSSWPCLFGASGDCRSGARHDRAVWSAAGPSEIWRRAVGRGYSSPIIDRGRAFILQRVDDREVLAALDLLSGELIWEQSNPTTFRCRYQYSDGPYATPRVDGDHIYTVGAEALLTCRATNGGQVVWQRNLTNDFQLKAGPYGFGAQLWVGPQRLVLNVGSPIAGIAAFEKKSGDTAWVSTDHGMAYTMPRVVRVANREFLVVLTDVGLVSLNERTGEVYDQFEFRSKVSESVTGVTPLVRGNRLVLVAGRGAGAVCLELDDVGRFNVVWRQPRALDSLFNTLVLDDVTIFGFTSTKQGSASLRGIDFKTGRVTWDFPSELERGQALAIDGTLIVIGEHGHLAAFDIRGNPPAMLWRSTNPVLAAPCYSAPAVADGVLVGRNESEIVAWRIGKR